MIRTCARPLDKQKRDKPNEFVKRTFLFDVRELVVKFWKEGSDAEPFGVLLKDIVKARPKPLPSPDSSPVSPGGGGVSRARLGCLECPSSRAGLVTCVQSARQTARV